MVGMKPLHYWPKVRVNPCPDTFGQGLFGLCSLDPVKGNLNSSVCNDMLDKNVLSTFWQQLGKTDSTWPCSQTQSQVHKETVFPVWCGKTSLARTDLNQHLYDESKL